VVTDCTHNPRIPVVEESERRRLTGERLPHEARVVLHREFQSPFMAAHYNSGRAATFVYRFPAGLIKIGARRGRMVQARPGNECRRPDFDNHPRASLVRLLTDGLGSPSYELRSIYRKWRQGNRTIDPAGAQAEA